MVETGAQAQGIVDAVRYACPADHEKRLIVAMIETHAAIDRLDEILAVEGIDVFFIGPGDLSQDMGHPPAPPFGQPRPQPVIDKVAEGVSRIRAAGRIAGTFATADEVPFWKERRVLLLYVHTDPFLRLGIAGLRQSLGR